MQNQLHCFILFFYFWTTVKAQMAFVHYVMTLFAKTRILCCIYFHGSSPQHLHIENDLEHFLL